MIKSFDLNEQAGKPMKVIKYVSVLVLAVGLTVISVAGQSKKPPAKRNTTTASKKPAPKPPVTSSMILAKEKVANQQSNVNRFIDVLGPIAVGIENIDADSKTKKLPKSAIDTNEENKRKVIIAIRNLRAGLVVLESEFRTKPELKKFLINIQGISDLSAEAEDSALAGKFVASKEPLRLAVRKLTDTLAVMP